MAKGERDWAQLDAFEAEYRDRLKDERDQVRRKTTERSAHAYSPYLDMLAAVAQGKDVDWLYREAEKSRDEQTRRLFALRGKILSLREKLGVATEGEGLLDIEKPYVDSPAPEVGTRPRRPGTVSWIASIQLRDDSGEQASTKNVHDPVRRIRFLSDPAPEGYIYPVTYDEIRAVLRELPQEHVATVHEIRLSHQRRTGSDGDWLDGEIRLHCLIREDGRRVMGRTETTADVQRFGGSFEWEGNKLVAVWPMEAFKTFVLRRVLIHEVAHGVAELPGYADRVRRAGSVEKFCEQYAENLYPVPMPNPGKGRGGRA